MKDYFRRYLEGRCSEDEFLTFINLFLKADNQKELAKNMKEDWKRNRTTKKMPDLLPTLHKIHFEINKQDKPEPGIRNFTRYLTRIAAILFIPLAIAFFFAVQKNLTSEIETHTVSTPLASKTNFKLPDGSMVYLNAGSSLSFPEKFTKKKRLVKLTGEAYFDVKKSSHPFEVETSALTVNVLGTAFNIMAYKDALPEVTLERGKVIVSTKSNQQKTLQPGEQAVINTTTNTISVNSVETELFTSWKDNRLIFKNEMLGNVAQKLERWYNISIDIEDERLEQKRINASIEYESISEIMELLEITLPLKFEYKKSERKLLIKSSQP
ncbi:FecR family protein [Maribellus maritimus]|uniref:FecR family protein n=1 Tax=Maribellus maritimus TaxID=2870838 RepID=UPI001EEB3756|nr:FecR domain-containing protein [Maribellus maritimus]MCG6190101.1 FecR domain-containing protein [Maribellus maritimus]